MPERTSYPEGTPNWVDLGTPDLDAAMLFYGRLFGWTFAGTDAEHGYYTLCLLDGLPVAGLGPQLGPEAPSMWNTYLASADADHTAGRIRDAGGRVLVEPLDVAEAGRMLYAVDPTGAGFGVWQGKEHVGSRRTEEPGAPSWYELHTADGATADEFYRSVFDHEHEQIGDGRTFDYTVIRVGDRAVGGRLRVGRDDPSGVRPHWMTYFAVADADAAAAAVGATGGTVLREPVDSPHGRLAVVADPWGAAFTVIRLPMA
jgi:predicted enzyme related to lactoylglutathione lyase